MPSSFQRRLTVAMGFLVAGTIFAMAAMVVWTAATNILAHYRAMTVGYSQLATRYIHDAAQLHEEETRRAVERITRAKVNLTQALRDSGSIPPGQSWEAFSELLDRSLQDLLEEVLPPYSLQKSVDDVYTRLNVVQAAVIDAEGRVVAVVGAPEGTPSGEVSPEVVRSGRQFLILGNPQPVTLSLGRQIGVLTRLEIPNRPAHALFLQHRLDRGIALVRNTVIYVSVFAVVLIVLSLFAAYRLSRQLSRPIDELARGVREYGDGNLDFQFDHQTKDEFQELVEAVGDMAGSLKDARDELEQETLRRERLEHELHIAAELQLALLPESPPSVEGAELLGWSRPAREVGGDFYDFVDLGSGRIAVAIGDATGKGLPAALLVTECWSILRTLMEESHSPGELLYRTNRALCRRTRITARFVTLFITVIDFDRRRITYASAGHNPPLLLGQGGRSLCLRADDGFPLGIVPEGPYSEHSLELVPGDTLLLYSDGLPEAQNECGDMYGEHRIQQMIAKYGERPLLELLAGLKHDMDSHVRNAEIHDDVTLVGVRIHAACPLPW